MKKTDKIALTNLALKVESTTQTVVDYDVPKGL